MKSLLITLLIMAPLSLYLCQGQETSLGALSGQPSQDGGAESAAAKSTGAIKPYQKPLDKAKGVEAMLKQGVSERMRSVDEFDNDG